MTTASLVQNPYGLPDGLPAAITKLSSPEVALAEACEEILALSAKSPAADPPKTDKTAPFLYDQGELAGKLPIAVTYAIKRLFRGLAAISMHTKLNYATVLRALLGEHSDSLPVATTLVWLQTALHKDSVSGDTKASSTVENAMLAGRLIGFDVLLATFGSVDKKVASGILKEAVAIWKDKEATCGLAQSVMLRVLCGLDEKERASCAEIVEKQLSGMEASSPRLAALVLAVRFQCRLASFGAGIAGLSGNLLQPAKFMPLIASVDANHLDRPSVLALYSALLKALSIERRLAEFQQGWDEASSVLLQHGKLGGPVLKCLLREFQNADEEIKQLLLTAPIVEYLSKDHSPSFDWAAFVTSSALAATTVATLLSCDQQSKSATVILGALDGDRCGKALDLLGSRDMSDQVAMRFADLHLAVLKPGFPASAEEHGKMMILHSLMKFALSRGQEATYSRVQGALVRLCDDASAPVDNWINACLVLVDQRFGASSKTGRRLLEQLDEPVRDAWEDALKLSSRIQKHAGKAKPDANAQSTLKALHTMVLTGRLMLVLDPLASASIFDDLKQCHKKLAGGKDSSDDGEVNPVDVLVDILLQWLSRASALLRRVADVTFALLVPDLTANGLAAIFNVLTAVPGAEEGEGLVEDEGELMEDDDEPVDDENEDEDEDEDEELVDDEDSLDVADGDEMEPSAKRMKSLNDSTTDLNDANAEELALLDKHLSAIMAARKQHQTAKTTSRQALVHFKQRVLDWMRIIVSGLPESVAFVAKVKMIPTLLELFRIHSVPKERAADSKYASDKELLDKATAIFNQLYSARSKPNLDERDMEMCRAAAQQQLEDIKCAEAGLLAKKFTAFWFVFEAVASEGETILATLRPLWNAVIREGDKKHTSVFLSFFEQLRSKSPATIVRLVSDQECLDFLFTARFYTREKIVRFTEPTLKPSLDREAGRAMFQSLARMYVQAIATEGGFLKGATVSQIRQEIPLLNTVVAKSRHYLSEDELSHWKPLLEGLLGHLETLKTDLQGSQYDALRSRIKSMQGLLNSQK